MPKFQRITFNLRAADVREEQLNGKTHLVMPMVMMTEGVHNGSQGPFYYPKTELEKAVPSWNHKPILIDHPRVKESGCNPKVINKQGVGVVLNTKWDGKQRAEAWIDKERLGQIAPEIALNIANKTITEISTGLFFETDGVPGVWNDEPHHGTAKDHKPDHLAILTTGEGACNIRKGAGLLQLNKAKGVKDKAVFLSMLYQLRKEVNEEITSIVEDDLSLNHLEDADMPKKKEKIDALIANTATKWAEKDRKVLEAMDDATLDLLEPIPPKVEKKEVKNKDPEESDEDEADDDEEEVVEEKKPAKNKKKVDNKKPEVPATDEAWLKLAPPGIRAVVQNAMAVAEKEKADLVKAITTNKKNRFTKEYLETQSVELLRGIAELARNEEAESGGPPPMYMGSYVPYPTNNSEDEENEALSLPIMNFGADNQADDDKEEEPVKKKKKKSA